MLQKVDKERLDKVLQVIDTAKIRFPLAEIVKRLNVDKGMVSSYLNGKKPISDKFYSNFMSEFAAETMNVMQEPAASINQYPVPARGLV